MFHMSETRDQINVVDDQIGGPTCAKDIAQTCFLALQLIQDPSKSGLSLQRSAQCQLVSVCKRYI